MKILTVSNIKGGVAKTTTASTLGAGLVKKGYRVLLIDSDPQTNLTMCFTDEPDDNTPSLYSIYSQKKNISETKFSISENFDLIPGDFNLCSADMEFLGKVGSLKYLTNALKSEEENYDFVIIDTPPNLGFLTLNAFMASDYIVTPMAADSFSLKAIRLLKSTIDDVSADSGRPLPVIGLLLTKYTDRTNLSKILENSVNQAADLLDTSLFDTRIRQATVVMESQLVKMSIFDYAPRSKVADEYESFIFELLKRMGVEK